MQEGGTQKLPRRWEWEDGVQSRYGMIDQYCTEGTNYPDPLSKHGAGEPAAHHSETWPDLWRSCQGPLTNTQRKIKGPPWGCSLGKEGEVSESTRCIRTPAKHCPAQAKRQQEQGSMAIVFEGVEGIRLLHWPPSERWVLWEKQHGQFRQPPKFRRAAEKEGPEEEMPFQQSSRCSFKRNNELLLSEESLPALPCLVFAKEVA